MLRKKSLVYLVFSILGTVLALLIAKVTMPVDQPADTYFSVAVSENSHNHYGENLLFLDFQEKPQQGTPHPRVVRSPRFKPGTIVLDGRMDDWNTEFITHIEGRVMNNYPLSEHYDATPTGIKIGSGYDDEYIYFVLQWEDANHDRSVKRNRWLYSNKQWVQTPHAIAEVGTPAHEAINRNDDLAGNEDEDQAFFMFPIVDQQGNFKDGSMGCGGYCHVSLSVAADPKQAHIGDGASAMHTSIPGDLADLWHWTATRSRPVNTLKDGYLDYGDESYNGRKVDDGTDPFEHNAKEESFSPLYIHQEHFKAGNYQQPEFSTQSLSKNNIIPITAEMTFAEGVSLPFYIEVPASGSRADVTTAANFDEALFLWTVEFRRKRVTTDAKDYQFVSGIDALPPSEPLVKRGDSGRGERLYKDKNCVACHGDKGEGLFEKGSWVYPRIQRVSGPSIRNTASPHRPRRIQNLAFELKKWSEEPPEALMPYVHLTAQEAEDIAAWLQRQYIPRGQ